MRRVRAMQGGKLACEVVPLKTVGKLWPFDPHRPVDRRN